jgi:hypothetical protein
VGKGGVTVRLSLNFIIGCWGYTLDLRSRVHVTLRLTVHTFSRSHPYKQTFVNCNNLVIQYKVYLWCTIVY